MTPNSVVEEELISKDLIGHLTEVDHDTGESDFFIGTNFISNFILLNKLVDDINNARNISKIFTK